MGTIGIARLAGRIAPNRRVPITGVHDEPERGAGGLVVAAPGVVHRIGIATPGSRSHVEAATHFFIERSAQRMTDVDVLVGFLAILPAVHVGTELLLKIVHCLHEAGEQD